MTERFVFTETPLRGLYRVTRNLISDNRGFFSRFFCAEAFKTIGLTRSIVQMNHTLTHKEGAVRGMHFQKPPYSETKIVACIAGKVWDVVVDIRKNSPTFLKWYAAQLSGENQISLFIPEGFAHGFQTLTKECQLLYLHSAPYEPGSEGALNVLDPMIAIDWPLEISEISMRDRHHPLLDFSYEGIVVE